MIAPDPGQLMLPRSKYISNAHALQTPVRRITEMINDLSRLCFIYSLSLLRRFVCLWHVVNVVYVVCRRATLFGYCFFVRFTVCFSLPMKKSNSNVDSVSEVSKSGITISAITSPKRLSLSDVCVESVSLCSANSSRFK